MAGGRLRSGIDHKRDVAYFLPCGGKVERERRLACSPLLANEGDHRHGEVSTCRHVDCPHSLEGSGNTPDGISRSRGIVPRRCNAAYDS